MKQMKRIDLSPLISTTKNYTRIVPKRSNEAWILLNFPDLHNQITNYSSYDFNTNLKLAYNNLKDIPLCKTCSKPITLKFSNNKQYCSNSCAIKSIECQIKTKTTCDLKYGKRFNVIRGSYNGMHTLQKHRTNLDDLNNKELMANLLKPNDWKIVAKHFNLTSKSHSSTFNLVRRAGYNFLPRSGGSLCETNLGEFIKSLGVDPIVHNRSVISPYEIDLLVDNLGIEFNGNYYHSYNSKETKDEINYHLNKTNLCETLGYQLLHIFEYEWMTKQDIVKSIIRTKLGKNEVIPARKCVIHEVPHLIAKSFLEKNHMQGWAQHKYAYGLHYNDRLVAIITFGKPRYSKTYDYEIIRFSSLLDITVIGGFSKLLKHFIESHSPKTIISYGNRRWCTILSNVYEKNGFKLIDKTSPNYVYIYGNEVLSRIKCQKHKLHTFLNNFDSGLTEYDNMFNNGYRRLWDCGNLKYVLVC